MPPAVPVIMAVGSKIAAGLAAAKGAAAAALAAKGGALAATKGALVVAGKVASAAGAIASGTKAIVDAAKGHDKAPAYDAEAENRKAQLASAKGARRRIAQQTQTLLTSPLGGLGRVGGGIAKTLLGH